MDVGDARRNGLVGPQVSVVSGAFLPEAKHGLSWPFSNMKPREKRGIVCFDIDFAASGAGSLDRREIRPNSWGRFHRSDQKMSVVWHENEREQFKAKFLVGSINGVRESDSRKLSQQEFFAPKAGKGQFMAVAWLMEMVERFVFHDLPANETNRLEA